MTNKKQIIINASILAVGLLLGWLIFGGINNDSLEADHTHDHSAHETEWWTCSMHPQIKQPDEGDCPICGMDLIPMSSGDTQTADNQIQMSENAVLLAGIQTEKVELSSAEKEIFLQGKVTPDERRISVQAAHFPGRIEKLHIAFEGEKVYAGRKLASIYSPELISAQAELFEALKSKDSYPQLLESARNKLKLRKLTEKQINQIEESGTIQEYFDVLSDVSGYVTKRKVSVGDYVKTGDVLFEVVDLSRLWVVFDAYQRDIHFLKKGDMIEINIDGAKTHNARIDYIDPVIDPITRATKVRAELANPEGKLKPDMYVSGKVYATLKHKEGAVTVPKSSVMWTGKRSIVYVKVPGTDMPVYEMREVVPGESLGALYIVEEGLKIGEEVVTHGTFTVDAAAQLNNKYSMMNLPESLITEDIPDFSNTASESFIMQLEDIYKYYLSMKESLVAANSLAVAQDAKKMQAAIKETDSSPLRTDARNYFSDQAEIITAELKAITGTKNIDTQRKAFKPMSSSVIRLAQSFGTKGDKLYLQFCPMADDDKGAFWLSNVREISNPYYGDMMLRCGELRDSIQ